MLKFDNLYVNFSVSQTITISSKLILNFARITGDYNPIHFDNKISRSTFFRGPIAHGFSYVIFFSKLVGNKLCKDPILWVDQNFSFKKKVRIGDKLTLICKITKLNKKHRIINIECSATNQSGQIVIKGNGQLKCLKLIPNLKANIVKKNKTALVIGGTRGIGRDIVKTFSELGYNTCFTYKDSEAMAKNICKKNDNLIAIRTDLKDINIDSIRKLIRQTFKTTIDIVIVSIPSSLNKNLVFENEYQHIENTIRLHLKPAYDICKKIIPEMKKNKYGRIIAIGSTLTENLQSKFSSYILGKLCLKTFIKILSLEYSQKNITFNTISPHYTDTELLSSFLEENEILYQQLINPSERLAHPDDISSCVKFLSSEESSYINGQNLILSGGAI